MKHYGTHPDVNVGVDAHIGPKPYGTSRYVEWDGGMGCLYNIFPFNRAWKYSNPARDDVGIVPYSETGTAYHSSDWFRVLTEAEGENAVTLTVIIVHGLFKSQQIPQKGAKMANKAAKNENSAEVQKLRRVRKRKPPLKGEAMRRKPDGRFVANVGADAHIGPCRGGLFSRVG